MISSEANELLNNIEIDLHNEEEMLNAFAQQQQEVCIVIFVLKIMPAY